MRDCIMQTDCVVKDGNMPSECLRNHLDELAEECQALRKAAFECKRGMLDMRNRFRGNVGAQFQYVPEEKPPAE
ncbi:cytochrome c oxidase assembly protein PET191-domain-containing protein [Roridomyces roridus]|uniref:Cytochrome c oxidase assembly protein PET191-domain-containing protein n=1 Tax=Roridomyces roridus TaxID=1738132 RepID=A0AAD7C4K9_9AGAR|nr:cytochrome c oxidase assembly protein PET191-domain-containing protein [Roridomyces roridus]